MRPRVVFIGMVAGCAPASLPEPQHVEIPVQAAQASPIVATTDPVPPEPETVVPIREEWIAPHAQPTYFVPTASKATTARTALESVSKKGPVGGYTPITWFGEANVLADRASRHYAAAFHAVDAKPEQRVSVALAAAEMALAWYARLDELGYTKTPAAWRADPSLALTFEEEQRGVGLRWRDEALALVRLCADVVKKNDVQGPEATRCLSLERRYGRVALARAAPTEKGTCRCAKGDPLCGSDEWCD